jgi:nucleoside 2-deoxyribosyltransferase
VATAAAEALDPAAVQARIVTMPVKNRPDGPNVFTLGQSVKPHGRNDRSRRLSILSRANVACLGGGGTGTQEIYDFARGLDLPVLPLPFLKGVCRQIWGRDHQSLAGDFGLDAFVCQRWQTLALDKINAASLEELAAEVAGALATGVRKRCLVCMPFSPQYDWVLDHVVQPAATAACVDLVRLDLENEVGNISSHFRRELARADCVLAVLTGARANVLYEIGFSHAAGLEVLLLCQIDPSVNAVEQIPFYLRNHRTIWYPEPGDAAGIAAAQQELCQTLRKAGRPAGP